MAPSTAEYKNTPSISIDTHFSNIPDLEQVNFDAEQCADLFRHVGIAEADLNRIHIYFRPDYDLAYPHKERKAAKKSSPEDYDDAGSCEILEEDSLFGAEGDVLITIIYGSGYKLGKLLVHEAVHAREMLKKRNILVRIWQSIPVIEERLDNKEEREADRAMNDIALAGLRKGILQVKKKKTKKAPWFN